MSKRITIDLSAHLINLEGTEVTTITHVHPNGAREDLPAQNMAKMLGDMCVIHKESKSPMKLIIFGEALYTKGCVEVDEADVATLQEVVTKNGSNNLVKARIGSILDDALTELKKKE